MKLVRSIPFGLWSEAKDVETEDRRLSVATNAAATAMFGVGTGVIEVDDQQLAAAKVIAARVLDHIDKFDKQ